MMDLIRDWLTLVLLGGLVAAFLRTRHFRKLAATREEEAAAARQQFENELIRLQGEARAAVASAQQHVDRQIAEMAQESERVRLHYEGEARRIQSEADEALAQLEALRKYTHLQNAEANTQRLLAEAMTEAAALRTEARGLLDESRMAAAEERSQASAKAKDIWRQADSLLDSATRDAGRIIEEAHKRAEQIAGDAYTALRDKERLEQAVAAIRNVINGYGDRYIIPTRSLLDSLAPISATRRLVMR